MLAYGQPKIFITCVGSRYLQNNEMENVSEKWRGRWVTLYNIMNVLFVIHSQPTKKKRANLTNFIWGKEAHFSNKNCRHFYFSNGISLLSGMETKDCKWYMSLYTVTPNRCNRQLSTDCMYVEYLPWSSTVPIGATVTFFGRCIAIVFTLSWNEIQKWIVIRKW